MGRPFLEKFADVQWEVNEEHLQAWKDGKTGYPIVDAAMRAGKARGECCRGDQTEWIRRLPFTASSRTSWFEVGLRC